MSNLRDLKVRSSVHFVEHDEAAALLDTVDAWLRATGTAWSHLCMKAGVSPSMRTSVRVKGNGMMRKSLVALTKAMDQHPQGITGEDVGMPLTLLNPSDTMAFASEMKAWLDRTGTAPWRLAASVGRTGAYLVNWMADPKPISGRTVARYRELMASNPDGLGRPVYDHTLKADAPPPPPMFDPLAERRGEADRQRKAWIAQQAAEHQRKYRMPMGRPIEEMVA